MATTSRFSLTLVNRMGQPIPGKPWLVTIDRVAQERASELLNRGLRINIRATPARIWLRVVDKNGNWSRANPSGMNLPRSTAGGDELGDPLGLAVASLITASHRYYCASK